MNLAFLHSGINEPQWLEYFKVVFLKIQNVPSSRVFPNPVTYKDVLWKKRAQRLIVLLASFTHLKIICQQRKAIMMTRFINPIATKCVIKETCLKVGCLAGFFHYHLTTTSAHMIAHHYTLFESGPKAGLWMITIHRKHLEL